MDEAMPPETAELTIALANIVVWVEQAEERITLLEIALAGTHATVAALKSDVDRARDPHRRRVGETGLVP